MQQWKSHQRSVQGCVSQGGGIRPRYTSELHLYRFSVKFAKVYYFGDRPNFLFLKLGFFLVEVHSVPLVN